MKVCIPNAGFGSLQTVGIEDDSLRLCLPAPLDRTLGSFTNYPSLSASQTAGKAHDHLPAFVLTEN